MPIKIKKIQTALFVRNFNVGDEYQKAIMITSLSQGIKDAFDAGPISLPLPTNAPQEIPRIIFNSRNGIYSSQIAMNRIDIFYNVPEDNTAELQDLLEGQRGNVELLYEFLQSNNAIINRVGFIVTFDYEPVDAPAPNGLEQLKSAYCQATKFDNSKEIILQINKNDEVAPGFNNLIKMNGRNDSNVIRVELDINTLKESIETSDFQRQVFDSIIGHAIEKTSAIIRDFSSFNL